MDLIFFAFIEPTYIFLVGLSLVFVALLMAVCSSRGCLLIFSVFIIFSLMLFGFYWFLEREDIGWREESEYDELNIEEQKTLENNLRLSSIEDLNSEIYCFARNNSKATTSMIESLKNVIIKFENNAENTGKRLETLGEQKETDWHYQKWIFQKEKAEKTLVSLVEDLEKIWCEEPFCTQEELKKEFDDLNNNFSPAISNFEKQL